MRASVRSAGPLLLVLVVAATCHVDSSGLGEGSGGGGTAGAAGAGGTAVVPTGLGGSPGTAGTTGSGGPGGTTGVAASGGATPAGGTTGAAGDLSPTGLAGATGAAGDTGTAGDGAGGDTGSAGDGAAGDTGTGVGGSGVAGDSGTAGSGTGGGGGGSGGMTGSAGTGAAASGGRGGNGGRGAGGQSGCGPSTCPTGCCRNNLCVTNLTDQSCGTNGAACTACGSCFRCGTSRACEPDPSANWNLVCGSATIAPTKPNGMPWDTGISIGNGPNPDPFCRLTTSDGRSRSSNVINDTLTPVWNANVTPTTGGGLTAKMLSTAGTWTLTVYDQDATGIGSGMELICSVSPAVTTAEFQSGTLSFSSVGSCTQLTLGLTCGP